MKLSKFSLVAAAAAACVHAYEVPSLSEYTDMISLVETFQGDDISGWVQSVHERYNGQEWAHEETNAAFSGDKGLVVKQKHKHYGISKVLDEPLDLGQEEITLQYEVRFHEGISCSGAYIKFLAEDSEFKPENLEEASPYVIMFGPDKCGSNNKVHLIFRHQNPVSGEWEEKHMKETVPVALDKLSHVYTLQLKAKDQSFRILIDREEKARGYLTSDTDFTPSFNAPKQIDDPDDKKPADWVDEKKIADPSATKPDDWDEEAPEEIPDPSASMPEDWDEEDDGEWEAPLIKNPDYKGKWHAPMIDNPDYKGEWAPQKIDNPNYFEQDKPLNHLPKIGAVAIEILANEADIGFDNIMLTSDFLSAKKFAEGTTLLKTAEEKSQTEQESRDKRKAEREQKLAEGGVQAQAEYYVGEVSDWIQANKTQFGIGCMLFFGSILLYLFRSSSTAPITEEVTAEAKHKKDDDTNMEPDDETEDEDAEDEIEELDTEEEEEDKKATRRRPRRAD